MVKLERQDGDEMLANDNFFSHDIGKLITVVKDSGPGIDYVD